MKGGGPTKRRRSRGKRRRGGNKSKPRHKKKSGEKRDDQTSKKGPNNQLQKDRSCVWFGIHWGYSGNMKTPLKKSISGSPSIEKKLPIRKDKITNDGGNERMDSRGQKSRVSRPFGGKQTLQGREPRRR